MQDTCQITLLPGGSLLYYPGGKPITLLPGGVYYPLQGLLHPFGPLDLFWALVHRALPLVGVVLKDQFEIGFRVEGCRKSFRGSF